MQEVHQSYLDLLSVAVVAAEQVLVAVQQVAQQQVVFAAVLFLLVVALAPVLWMTLIVRLPLIWLPIPAWISPVDQDQACHQDQADCWVSKNP